CGVLPRRRDCDTWPSRLVQVAQPAPEAIELRLDLLRSLAIPLGAAGQPLEAHRLAPRERNRCEVADAPALRAVDGGADYRHVPLQRGHGGTGLDVPGHAASLPRPLDVPAERTSVLDDL